MSLNESLAKTSKELMLKEPFYGLYLLMLNKQWSDRVPTAGVSRNNINYQLEINPDFWESLGDSYKRGILKHELLHIAFFHILRQNEFFDHRIANMAMDMEINQYIDHGDLPARDMSKKDFEEKYKPIIKELKEKLSSGSISPEEFKAEMYKIPSRGIYIEDYAHLGLDLKAGTRYYYDKLEEARKNGDPQVCEMCEGGNPGGEYDPGGEPNHDTWKEFSELDSATQRLLGDQADFHLKSIAEQIKKSRGTVPGELADYLDKLLNPPPPKFDWRSYLRRFAGGSNKVFTKKLRRKPNKRFEDMPGIKVKNKRHVLVAVDTSGSVSNEELKEFFNEIEHIHRTGTDITVVQCDAAISHVGPYKSGHKINIHGRGGTSFDPPVNYFNEHRRKFTCMIYLTDGECSPPANKPHGKVLWVLSSSSQMNNELPGHVIQLN